MDAAPPARTSVRPLLGLLLLAIVVHGWVLVNTAVPARDGIGFIRYAWHLYQPPLGADGVPISRATVFRQAEQAPGYPVLILLTATLLGGPRPDPEWMMWVAQLTSAIAGVLLVVPVYAVGRRWFGAPAGVVAAAWTQLLPAFAFITSDSLSDAWYLLLLACGVWAAARAFAQPTSGCFALVGVCAALTYLVRPEGALLAVAAGGVLLCTRQKVLPHGAALVAGAVALAGPWMCFTGKFSNKPTANAVMHAQHATGPLVAAWMSDSLREGPLSPRVRWASQALLSEMVQSFFYVGLPLALVGLWWTRRRWQTLPGVWVPLTIVGLQSLLLFKMATVVGYLSERHTLPLVLLSMIGVGALATNWRWASRLVLGLAVLTAPALCKPMHANRVGHHLAGTWLATHATAADDIYDPFCWSHYYAGRVFADREEWPAARVCYVVVESSTNQHSRLPMLPIARTVVRGAERVYAEQNVEIYRIVREEK
jgi:4-amino-4-deoxy-L-arabinose transferase-like glycosyltransferase